MSGRALHKKGESFSWALFYDSDLIPCTLHKKSADMIVGFPKRRATSIGVTSVP